MVISIATLALTAALALVAGVAAGWLLCRLGQRGLLREQDAYNRELVRSANVARDRAREERVEVETRLEALRTEHAACGESIGGMRRRLERARESASAAEAEAEELKARLARAEQLLGEREEGQARLAHELQAALADTEQAERARDAAHTSKETLEAALEQRKAEVRRLRGESPRTEHPSFEGRGGDERSDATLFGASPAAVSDAHVNEGVPMPAGSGVDAAEAAVAVDVGAPPATDAPAAPGHAERNPPGWLQAKPTGPKDPLSRIRGLGRTTEQRLNALGVFHFSQLSSMTDEDAAWLAARIQVPPERILRERWASQARSLESDRKT